MSYGSKLYTDLRAAGRKPFEFYIVDCPFCGVSKGRHCVQKSLVIKGEAKYFPPHTARIKLALKQDQ